MESVVKMGRTVCGVQMSGGAWRVAHRLIGPVLERSSVPPLQLEPAILQLRALDP